MLCNSYIEFYIVDPSHSRRSSFFGFLYQTLLNLYIYKSKILELEEELKVVGNNMKSLENSEQEVVELVFLNPEILLR